MRGYKLVTHDYRPPIQGGKPIFDGTVPFVLPKRKLDTSGQECAPGWNFTRRPETALRIGGLWPTGRPSVLLRVETIGEWVERGDKCRAESLRIVAICSERTVREGVRGLSTSFGVHRDQMVRDQMAWRRALARPGRDAAKVEAGLRSALKARELDHWTLRRFEAARAAWAARDARDAWDAWATRDAWAAWAAWAAWDARDARAAWAARAAWDAWDARDAWDAWAAWNARATRAAWDAWDARAAWATRAAWAAWDAWAAWNARDALTVGYASLMGWMENPSYMLTSGLRDAYRHGLAIAIPIGPTELGWAMEP